MRAFPEGRIVYEFVGPNDVLPVIAEGRRHIDSRLHPGISAHRRLPQVPGGTFWQNALPPDWSWPT